QEGGRLCVLGVMAADFLTLPPGPAGEACSLTANLLGWLTRFFSRAKAEGELVDRIKPDSAAASFLATLQGALLLERTAGPGIARQAVHASLMEIANPGKGAIKS